MGLSNREECCVRYNDLYHLYGAPDIVTDIKLTRLRWLGHIQRKNGNEAAKKKRTIRKWGKEG